MQVLKPASSLPQACGPAGRPTRRTSQGTPAACALQQAQLPGPTFLWSAVASIRKPGACSERLKSLRSFHRSLSSFSLSLFLRRALEPFTLDDHRLLPAFNYHAHNMRSQPPTASAGKLCNTQAARLRSARVPGPLPQPLLPEAHSSEQLADLGQFRDALLELESISVGVETALNLTPQEILDSMRNS